MAATKLTDSSHAVGVIAIATQRPPNARLEDGLRDDTWHSVDWGHWQPRPRVRAPA